MLKIIQKLPSKTLLTQCLQSTQIRTLLSPAYYLNTEWNQRFNTPILKAVKLDELYFKLDQNYQKTGEISAVDVDIFANALNKESSFVDELLDLLHKLRMTPETGSTLNGTHHAVVRYLHENNRDNELLTLLDDRLNYGIFLDYYSANILMNTYLKQKDYLSGVRVAAQLMLQEECEHPISRYLTFLHSYNYLLNPVEWPTVPSPEEPEEVVKVRVRYLRNPYDDEHFDLREGTKIIGKTLVNFTKKLDDPLSKSFHILGLVLFNKLPTAQKVLDDCKSRNVKLYSEVLALIPKESELDLSSVESESIDVQTTLNDLASKAVKELEENDLKQQTSLFSQWIKERQNALETEQKRLLTIKRLADIEEMKQSLKDRETKLWFFDNEEKIELAIEEEEREKQAKEATVVKTSSEDKKVDEEYIPPEIR